MSTETPHQRRTRLIEQYAGLIVRTVEHKAMWNPDAYVKAASDIADAVIAATPPAPAEREDVQLYVDRCNHALKSAPAERYPSEIETRLIDLCERLIKLWHVALGYSPVTSRESDELAAIKRDLSLS